MMRAIRNVQQAILMSPKRIIVKDDFFDNKVENLRNLNKVERNEILMLETKRRYFGNWMYQLNTSNLYCRMNKIKKLMWLKHIISEKKKSTNDLQRIAISIGTKI